MLVKVYEDEEACANEMVTFLRSDGEARAFIYLSNKWEWQRLRGLVDTKMPERRSTVVWRKDAEVVALNYYNEKRIAHVTRCLPESIDQKKITFACMTKHGTPEQFEDFQRLTS